MTYGYIFVAQASSTADYSHLIKTIMIAEAYDGPSLIICYSPCITHGIEGGFGYSGEQSELTTKCGYWPLYTSDPRLEKQGKNLLAMIGGEPDWDLYESFLISEIRYNSLEKSNPEHARELFEHNKKGAQHRYRQLRRIITAGFSDEVKS